MAHLPIGTGVPIVTSLRLKISWYRVYGLYAPMFYAYSPYIRYQLILSGPEFLRRVRQETSILLSKKMKIMVRAPSAPFAFDKQNY
eukprot:scaffold117312_cov39-Attheya_sp.AAC.2